jgi:hypothetical protein
MGGGKRGGDEGSEMVREVTEVGTREKRWWGRGEGWRLREKRWRGREER